MAVFGRICRILRPIFHISHAVAGGSDMGRLILPGIGSFVAIILVFSEKEEIFITVTLIKKYDFHCYIFLAIYVFLCIYESNMHRR